MPLRSLVIALDLPLPALGGGDLRTLAVVEALARLGPVGVFGVHPRPPQPSPIAGLAAWRSSSDSALADPRVQGRAALSWLTTEDGHPSDRWWSEIAAGELAQLADELEPQLVVVEQLWVYRYGEAIRAPGRRLVLNAHNAEATLHDDLARDSGRGRLPAALARTLAERVALREAAAVAAADQTWAPSVRDAAALAACHPHGAVRIDVVPSGIRVDAYAGPVGERGPVMVYPADFAYPPNEDAARRLVSGVLPVVRDAVGDATLVLVARQPRAGELAPAESCRAAALTAFRSPDRVARDRRYFVKVNARRAAGQLASGTGSSTGARSRAARRRPPAGRGEQQRVSASRTSRRTSRPCGAESCWCRRRGDRERRARRGPRERGLPGRSRATPSSGCGSARRVLVFSRRDGAPRQREAFVLTPAPARRAALLSGARGRGCEVRAEMRPPGRQASRELRALTAYGAELTGAASRPARRPSRAARSAATETARSWIARPVESNIVIASGVLRPGASPASTAPSGVTCSRVTRPDATAPASSPPCDACSHSSQNSSQRLIASRLASALPEPSAPSMLRCWPTRRCALVDDDLGARRDAADDVAGERGRAVADLPAELGGQRLGGRRRADRSRRPARSRRRPCSARPTSR